MNVLDAHESPLARGFAKYYRSIFGFVLGNVQNTEALFAYLKRYHEEYGPNGYVLGRSLIENEERSGMSGAYRDTYDPSIPNIGSRMDRFHECYGAVSVDIREFAGVVGLADMLRKRSFAKVEFVPEKKFVIRGMRNPDMKDAGFVANDVELTPEFPIEIVQGWNSSGKTEYVRTVLKHLNQALNIGHVNAESMTMGGISEYAYVDRVVLNKDSKNLSSGQRDILSWIELLRIAETKDFVIVEADEIFSTMDARHSADFARTFIGRLRAMGKFAIVVTHNHEFANLFSTLPGVRSSHFHSEIDSDGTVVHRYRKVSGGIDDSKGVEVLKSAGIGKDWLT